ncbi:MAG: DPP IV N-terminal domain-containing protein [Desulfobacca sp.]|uniref:DPP IV N-terminal domain-containing protein n=1 Tax=Desulfobacca sp. TaxID=2067990 RepID=UPI004049ED62
MEKKRLCKIKVNPPLAFIALAIFTLFLQPLAVAAQGREYVDVRAPLAQKYVIAVPALQGPAEAGPELGTALAAQANRDLKVSGHFTVLDPAAFDASPIGTSPATNRLRALAALGSNLIIAGTWQQEGQQLVLDLRLLEPSSGNMLLGKRYRGGPNDGPRMISQFVNEIVFYLTGERGLPQGRLAFVSGSTDKKEIYLMDLGGQPKQLTRLGTLTLNPAWARDGREIFFCSYRGGYPALYAINPDTGSIRRLASHGTLNITPAAGPGGLLAATLNKDRDQEIYLMDRQGNIRQRLTTSPGIDVSPTFSPDGSQIAFVSNRAGSPQIFIMSSHGGQARRLTMSGPYNVSPCWSPKGDLIAYAGRTGSGFQIFVISPQGGSPRQLTQEGSNESPTFSPDGAFLACSSTRDGKPAIYVINVRTGAATRVTNLPGAQTQPAWAPH